MKTYAVTVTRDGKWWMVAIPDINGLTQARRLGEAAAMAREFIAVTEDLPIDEIEVHLEIVSLDGIDVAAEVARIDNERAAAARLERDASERATALAKSLAAKQIPVRDIGAAMGISYQRAHQLVNS